MQCSTHKPRGSLLLHHILSSGKIHWAAENAGSCLAGLTESVQCCTGSCLAIVCRSNDPVWKNSAARTGPHALHTCGSVVGNVVSTAFHNQDSMSAACSTKAGLGFVRRSGCSCKRTRPCEGPDPQGLVLSLRLCRVSLFSMVVTVADLPGLCAFSDPTRAFFVLLVGFFLQPAWLWCWALSRKPV